MHNERGFKEANIAHDLATAFRKQGFLAYPEFPFKGGSIDALFVKGNDIVICEWKKLSPRSIPKLTLQKKRMLQFNPRREMAAHEFKPRPWRTSWLWVCDTWFPDCREWWLGPRSKLTTKNPFDRQWQRGALTFNHLPKDWDPYCWLWAVKEPSERFVWKDSDIVFKQ